MIHAKKGFIKLILLLLIIMIGIGIYSYKYSNPESSEKISPENSLQENNFSAQSIVPNPIGLWKLDKGYSFNEKSKQFELIPDFHLYMEYTKDGKWCSQWADESSTKCNNYDTYTFDKDYIKQNQVGLTGPEWRYAWKIKDGNLELNTEIYDEKLKTWSTNILKYSLTQVKE